MSETNTTPHVLENRHTGERLELRRSSADATAALEMVGTIPAGRASLSVHSHDRQDLTITVKSGTMNVLLGPSRGELTEGEQITVPRGAPYRLWNESGSAVEYHAVAEPAGDLDQYLQGFFQVVNDAPWNSPDLAYLARLHLRHQDTQSVQLLFPMFQYPLFLWEVLKGFLKGRFRGDDWPGAPNRCPGIEYHPPADEPRREALKQQAAGA